MIANLNLTNRVAVVIGATSGLGRTVAMGLARHGADVVPTGRRKERLCNACHEITAMGRRTLSHPVDVTDRGSLESLRDTVLAELGAVDILVNAAGYTLRKPTVQVTD